ncbi:MAG: hypothetical protein Q4E67_03850, partial [Planctomycetia bacterium]|nr:hypothetical protein [Planctomycetia bacterium]
PNSSEKKEFFLFFLQNFYFFSLFFPFFALSFPLLELVKEEKTAQKHKNNSDTAATKILEKEGNKGYICFKSTRRSQNDAFAKI